MDFRKATLIKAFCHFPPPDDCVTTQEKILRSLSPHTYMSTSSGESLFHA